MSTHSPATTRFSACIHAIGPRFRRFIILPAVRAWEVCVCLSGVSGRALVIALLGLLVLDYGSTAADSTTQLILSPTVQFAVVDEVVQIDVLVVDVSAVFSGQFTLRFDPAIVQVLDVEPGPLLEGATPIIRVDEESGTLLYAASLTSPAGPVTGSGPIATLTLLGLAEGSTVLLLEGTLSDVNGGYLPATVRGGTFNVTAEPVPESARQPTATEPPSTQPESEPSATATAPVQESASPTLLPVPPGGLPPSPTSTLSPQSATPTIGLPTQTSLPPLITSPTVGSSDTRVTEGVSSPTVELVEPTSTALTQASATEVVALDATPRTADSDTAALRPTGEEEAAMTGVLSTGLFFSILSILLLGVGVLAIIVLLSIWTWYYGGGQ